jgi:hypothetical protein
MRCVNYDTPIIFIQGVVFLVEFPENPPAVEDPNGLNRVGVL